MDTGILVAFTGGGFTLVGVLYAEYIRRSNSIAIAKLDDRQAFTDTITKAWNTCKDSLEASEQIRHSLDRKIGRQTNVLEIIEFEIDGIRPFHEELIQQLQDEGLKDLSMRYTRMFTRIHNLLQHLKDPQPLIGAKGATDENV